MPFTCPEQVVELVERFERNREVYTSGHYNETQLRREFLDPFFIALGWDVNNKSGYAEAYKDVIHEDAIKIGGAIALFATGTELKHDTPSAERLYFLDEFGLQVYSY